MLRVHDIKKRNLPSKFWSLRRNHHQNKRLEKQYHIVISKSISSCCIRQMADGRWQNVSL